MTSACHPAIDLAICLSFHTASSSPECTDPRASRSCPLTPRRSSSTPSPPPPSVALWSAVLAEPRSKRLRLPASWAVWAHVTPAALNAAEPSSRLLTRSSLDPVKARTSSSRALSISRMPSRSEPRSACAAARLFRSATTACSRCSAPSLRLCSACTASSRRRLASASWSADSLEASSCAVRPSICATALLSSALSLALTSSSSCLAPARKSFSAWSCFTLEANASASSLSRPSSAVLRSS
mmetsp:Transcript_15953/g.37818  ORF Transcript_15953/g.37818 Transcript_15953/m.37818 type:complete len:241 (+) Transcript_15953:431-1153(+)